MKKLFSIFLAWLLTFPAFGQTTIQNVSVAPSGNCQSGSKPQQLIATGIIYTCQNGVWGIGNASATAFTVEATDPAFGYVNGQNFNTQSVCDATFQVTSQTVTTPSSDPPFQSGDVGKTMWGSEAQCGGEDGGTSVNPVVVIAKGTILAVVGPHQVTVSNASSANCTPVNDDNCVFVWGNFDGSVVAAAWAATVAAGCPASFHMPSGGIMLTTPPVATSICEGNGPSNGAEFGYSVFGNGQYATMIYMTPDSTFANCMFTATPTIGAFYMRIHDFGISSFSPGGSSSNGKFGLCNNAVYSEFDHLYFLEYFPNTSGNNFTGLEVSTCGNCEQNIHDIVMESGGASGIAVSGDHIFVTNVLVQNSPITNVSVNACNGCHVYLTNVHAPLGGNGDGSNAGGLLVNESGGTGTVIAKNSFFQGGSAPSNAGDGCTVDTGILILEDSGCSGISSSIAFGLRVGAGASAI